MGSFVLELGEGTLAQCAVAVITLKYSEHDGARSVLTFSYDNHMTFAFEKNRVAVLPTYRRVCKFIILIHFLALTVLYKNNTCTFSVLMLLRENEF